MKKLCMLALVAALVMARPAGAAPPSGWVAQGDGNRLITSVVVTSPPEWAAGQVLNVTLTGQPGGMATFDMGPILGIALFEGPPGTYRGTYVLTPTDADLANPVVTGHLRMPSGQTDYWRPNAAPAAPLTVSVNSGGLQTLAPGQTFQITVQGPPGGYGTADVGPRVGLPLSEVAPGVYMTSYTVQTGDPPTVYVVGHLTVNGVPYQATAPQPMYLGSGRPAITNIAPSQPGPFTPGQAASLTVQATPGYYVSLSTQLGGSTQLTEVSPGTYVGTYPIPMNATPGVLPVYVTLADPRTGQVLASPPPFNLAIGAVPVATGNVVIDAPTMRSDVQAGFSVQGRSAPGAILLVQVFLTKDEMPGGDLFDKQFETQVQAGPDGGFNVPIVLNGATSGRRLDVRVRSLDANGNAVGQDEVVVNLR